MTHRTNTPSYRRQHPTRGHERKYEIGAIFGSLTIVARYARNVICECTCGNTITTTISSLQLNKTTCGACSIDFDFLSETPPEPEAET